MCSITRQVARAKLRAEVNRMNKPAGVRRMEFNQQWKRGLVQDRPWFTRHPVIGRRGWVPRVKCMARYRPLGDGS